MTSRERVYRALNFETPDRVPRDLWALPVAVIEHGPEKMKALRENWPTDFGSPSSGIKPLLVQGEQHSIGSYTDEWGCVFENIHEGVIGEVKSPIIDDWSKLADLREPVELLDLDVEHINEQCRASGKFMLSKVLARPFERCQFLRGSEFALMDLAEASTDFMTMLQRVHTFYCREIEVWSRTDVDGIFCMDDWGTQNALLINPATWREMFKPLYAEYVRIAHDGGKKFFLHSDGHIAAILEDLIEIGVDAINSQLFCMDIEQLGQRCKGRITFWGEIDRQRILPYGSEEDARAAVNRIINALGRKDGGLIAQFEMSLSSQYANAVAIYDQWVQYPQSLGWYTSNALTCRR